MAKQRGAKAGGGAREPAATRARREPERKKRDAYREVLLDVAERTFAEKGLDGARMADIAQGAGVATGTIYNYFENKNDIFRSLVELRGSEFVSRLKVAFEGESSPLQRLEALIQSSLKYLEEHRGTFAVFMELGATSESGIRRAGGVRAERLYRECVSLMEEAIQECIAAGSMPKEVPSADLVSLLLGAMNGLVSAWIVGRIHGPLSSRRRMLYEFFLRGAGASP